MSEELYSINKTFPQVTQPATAMGKTESFSRIIFENRVRIVETPLMILDDSGVVRIGSELPVRIVAESSTLTGAIDQDITPVETSRCHLSEDYFHVCC